VISTNWLENNEDFRRRGDITIGFTEEALEPGNFVIVDLTGLKVCGKDEGHQEKHGVPARRTLHKLHLTVIEKDSRIGWQKKTSYIDRAIQRYKGHHQ